MSRAAFARASIVVALLAGNLLIASPAQAACSMSVNSPHKVPPMIEVTGQASCSGTAVHVVICLQSGGQGAWANLSCSSTAGATVRSSAQATAVFPCIASGFYRGQMTVTSNSGTLNATVNGPSAFISCP